MRSIAAGANLGDGARGLPRPGERLELELCVERREHALADGDVLELFPFRLRFEVGGRKSS